MSKTATKPSLFESIFEDADRIKADARKAIKEGKKQLGDLDRDYNKARRELISKINSIAQIAGVQGIEDDTGSASNGSPTKAKSKGKSGTNVGRGRNAEFLIELLGNGKPMAKADIEKRFAAEGLKTSSLGTMLSSYKGKAFGDYTLKSPNRGEWQLVKK